MTARGQVVALYCLAISLSGLFLFGALPLLGAARTLSLHLEALTREKGGRWERSAVGIDVRGARPGSGSNPR